MKKILCLVMALALTFSLCLTVNAATGINANEKAVLDELKSKEALGKNGWSFFIPTEYVTAAENYFNTIDMTDAQKDTILGLIAEGKKIVKEQGDKANFTGKVYNLKTMEIPAKEKVLELGQKACKEVGLTLTYSSKDNKVIIKDAKGVVAFENTPIVKTTGESFNVTSAVVITAISVVILAGVAYLVIVAKKKALFVK
ncbi:MAG: hypothetical protein IKV81_00565 [Clostridia bacterium]|nr:hypothetical protein [Clostridia bacterium]